MKKNIVILGIGSNIKAESNIKKLLKILPNKLEVISVSTLKKTKPIGITNQPDFTNGAIKIKTSLSKNRLKQLLTDIENKLGRDRTQPKDGPRTIDIDIVIWNGHIEDTDYYFRNFLRDAVDEIT